MAVAIFLRWEGFTREQYDAARALAPLDRDTAPGCLLHLAAFDDHGIRVTDVWESADHFQAYLANHLTSAFAQLQTTGHPEVEIVPIHALETLAFTPI